MWQPIETAPKDGTEFLAATAEFIGVGQFCRHVEPETVRDSTAWKAYYNKIHEPFRNIAWTRNGTFPEGFDYMDHCRREREAWDAAESDAPPSVDIPNPKAGEVTEWFYALAYEATTYSGDATDDEGRPAYFTPTHWQPLPDPPQ